MNAHSAGVAFVPLPQDQGGADITLVQLDEYGKPSCVLHGAMNKVSPDGIWRCIGLSGPKFNPCRAGCIEANRDGGGGILAW